MLRHQLPEPFKVFSVQSFQILTVDIFTVLVQVGACTDIFNQLFGSGIVILETIRIIADQIDPGAAAFASGSDQGAVMTAQLSEHWVVFRIGGVRPSRQFSV